MRPSSVSLASVKMASAKSGEGQDGWRQRFSASLFAGSSQFREIIGRPVAFVSCAYRGWAGLKCPFQKSVHSTGYSLRGWPDLARGHAKCPWDDVV